MAGTYVLTATIGDITGLSTTSSVSVTVNQTLTSITAGGQPLAATAFDQFGNPLASQPALDSGSGTITSPLTLNGSVTMLPAAGSQLTISGGIGGAGGLIVNGPGTVILAGANTYTGGTTVSNGTLQATAAAALPSGGCLTVGAGGIFIFDPSSSAGQIATTTTVTLAAPADMTAGNNEAAANSNASSLPLSSAAIIVPAAPVVQHVHTADRLLFAPVSAPVLPAAAATSPAMSSVAGDAVFTSYRSAFDLTIAPADNAQPAHPWAWLAASESCWNSSDQNKTTDSATAALDKVLARFGL
jgi:autotransporter-associated beta strand protein